MQDDHVVEATGTTTPADAATPEYAYHDAGEHSHSHAHGSLGIHIHRHRHDGGEAYHTHDEDHPLHAQHPDHLMYHPGG